MALKDIQADVTSILQRRDLTVSQCNVFIAKGMRLIQKTLRAPSMEKLFIIQASGGNLASFELPQGLLQIIDIFCDGRSLTLKSFRQIAHQVRVPLPASIGALPTIPTGAVAAGFLPREYARVGAVIYVAPFLPAGGEILVTYYGAFTPLVLPTDENELTVSAPDLLTYAALGYAGEFYAHDSSTEWKQTFSALLATEQDNADQLDQTGGPMVVSPAYHDTEYGGYWE